MTELARTETFAPALNGFTRTARPGHAPKNEQFDRMGKWLELFIATEQVANVLARTAFVPEPMRGQPENIAAAMMKSLELGIDPLDGLSCIHVVKGKIGFSAEFMRRRIIEAGHEIIIDESTDERCKIRGRRAGSTEWQTVSFTADQARKAKITLGDYPADKLVARASSRLCRRVFPDVLAGTTIVDEIEEDSAETAPTASVQRKRQPRKVTATRAPAPAAGDVDELLDEPQSPQAKGTPGQLDDDDLLDDGDVGGNGAESDLARREADAENPSITRPQLQKLSILRQREGYPDTDEGRTDWFQMVEVNIGRRVASNKELSKAEASVLIDVLESERTTDRGNTDG